jgi:hypothetical protein
MFDTMRGEDCSFRKASDGTIRCLPSFQASVQTFYADMVCSREIAYAPKRCGSPAYAAKFDTACTDANSLRLFPTTEYDGPVFQGPPGHCTLVTATFRATYDFYVLGPEVPPSSFVAGAAGQDP